MDKREATLEILAQLSGMDFRALEPKMELVADLGIDSPKALQLLVEIEEKLGIEISDEDAARMDTVGDVLGYVGSLA
ncbi:MAG TPA: acyl carrier protein [Thermoanaerobaculia bacterium]|jgi:acyl carrier protein